MDMTQLFILYSMHRTQSEKEDEYDQDILKDIWDESEIEDDPPMPEDIWEEHDRLVDSLDF